MALSFCIDGFRIIYVIITTALWLFSSVFSVDYFQGSKHKARYHLSSLLTLTATIGVFLSADLFTTFVFFEIMSFTSYPMVAHDESPAAQDAAGTYLAVAVIGGMTTLMGLLMLRNLTGTLDFKLLHDACEALESKRMLYVSGGLILVGFAAKAGLFPLHIWLPKAHPAAPAPASALLSGILTKCGVFGVIIVSCEMFLNDISWGTALLIIGAVTMLHGAVLAVFSTDLKRTLACSSISQIGFVTVGIAMSCILGDHGSLAARGAFLHMVNHSFFKLALFLAAGIVYMNVHSIDFRDIRGFARGKPLFACVFVIASAGIAGVPFFSGYISKTLLHESIVEGVTLFKDSAAVYSARIAWLLRAAEVLFIFTGGLTTAYMLRLNAVLFAGRRRRGRSYVPRALRRSEREAGSAAMPLPERVDSSHDSARGDTERRHAQAKSKMSSVILALSAIILLALSFIPGLMERIADYGESFLHGHSSASVHYFSWENLRGAVLSITIGAAVYFLFIRTVLERKAQTGARVYFNRLMLSKTAARPEPDAASQLRSEAMDGPEPDAAGAHRTLDLEHLVYRPLISAFTYTGALLSRFVCDVPDAFVGLILRTLLRPFRPGRIAGILRERFPRIFPEGFPGRFYGKYYMLLHPEKNEQPAVQPVVHAGFSVSLLLLGIGMCAVLLYLVIVYGL